MIAQEASKYLKVHEITIYRLAKQGKIFGFKVGKQWRFKKEKIKNLPRFKNK